MMHIHVLHARRCQDETDRPLARSPARAAKVATTWLQAPLVLTPPSILSPSNAILLGTHVGTPLTVGFSILGRIACVAFIDVFQKRQTKHADLLAWLKAQRGLHATQERRLSAAIAS
jgi:hypothetical protein